VFRGKLLLVALGPLHDALLDFEVVLKSGETGLGLAKHPLEFPLLCNLVSEIFAFFLHQLVLLQDVFVVHNLLIGFFNLGVKGLEDLNLFFFVAFGARVHLNVRLAGKVNLNLLDGGRELAFLFLQPQVFFYKFVKILTEARCQFCRLLACSVRLDLLDLPLQFDRNLANFLFQLLVPFFKICVLLPELFVAICFLSDDLLSA